MDSFCPNGRSLQRWGTIGFFLLQSSCAFRQRDPLPPSQAQPLPKSAAAKEEAEAAAEDAAAAEAASEAATPSGPLLPWEKETFSPRPGSSPDPLLEGAELACGEGDVSLHEAAEWLATHFSEHQGPSSIDFANFQLRRRGSPYVMPRLWAAQMTKLDAAAIESAVKEWAQQRPALGQYRCGVAAAQLEGGDYGVIVLQADVLVDLLPVPTKVETGTWLKLEARLLSSASEASVLLLPPDGLPRHLRTQLEGSTLKARFPIETAGTWLIQLMATVSGGPRPVAQMLVTAGIDPPQAPDERKVPGEGGIDNKASADDALFAAINEARADQGLPELKRNRRLDAVARAHSETMMSLGRISHDTGQGNPAFRVEEAGIHPKATGENVALAGSVVRLHRALWASPSHRENMLLRRWNEVGVAVLVGEDDLLYATQLYIDSD
jgi:uncharacterized protein YkwD